MNIEDLILNLVGDSLTISILVYAWWSSNRERQENEQYYRKKEELTFGLLLDLVRKVMTSFDGKDDNNLTD